MQPSSSIQEKLPEAKLVLEDGTEYHGHSFGSSRNTSGELIFNTTMVGYCEALTDPTFAGQVLTLTWPLVGNSGVPPQTEDRGVRQFFESSRIWPRGLVVSEYSPHYSHWNAVRPLADWLQEENVPAITGIDTRAIAKRIRDKGTMLGRIEVTGVKWDTPEEKTFDPRKRNMIAEVSCKETIEYEPNAELRATVLLIDCGVKNSVIRNLTNRGAKVIRVPWNHDISGMKYDGVVISNGPGDPAFAGETVENIKRAIAMDKPVFGICIGNLLLGQAVGAKMVRLPFGHHSSNQPVKLCGADRTYVTPQNHNFTIDPKSLSSDWEPWFENLNDGTCAGIRHKTKPFMAVQFHPEHCGGPKDSENLYDKFFEMV